MRRGVFWRERRGPNRRRKGKAMTNYLLRCIAIAGKVWDFVGPARKSGLRSPHGVTGGVGVGPIRARTLTLSNTPDSQ